MVRQLGGRALLNLYQATMRKLWIQGGRGGRYVEGNTAEPQYIASVNSLLDPSNPD